MERTCDVCGRVIGEALPEIPICPSCLSSIGLGGRTQAYLQEILPGSGEDPEADAENEEDGPGRESGSPDPPDEAHPAADDPVGENGSDECARA